MSANNTPTKPGTTTPRAASPSTPKPKLSSPPSAPSSGSAPRPMPPIDHSQELPGWNALPAASARAQAFALGSFDNMFLRLQSEFTKLSAMEASLNAQNQQYQSDLEKLERKNEVVAAQYNTAIDQDKHNKVVEDLLNQARDAVRSREAAVSARERDVEKREKQMNRKAHFVTEGDIAAAAFGGDEMLSGAAYDPHSRSLSTLGDSAADQEVVPDALSTLSNNDEPPRGRTLTSASLQQYDNIPGSATSTSSLAMRVFNAAEISPFRRHPVLPRRVSSANMSCATPTPTRTTAEGDETASVETGVEGESVYESAEENVATAVQMQMGRARGRSVRRVSRNENLRGQ